MSLSIAQRISLAEKGTNPNAIARLQSGWLIAADTQPVFGYCILLAAPLVRDFNTLAEAQRASYALDCGRVGDALLKITGAYRINYETWGNLDPALHTHIVPRYENEAADKRILPICRAYDIAVAPPFDAGANREFVENMRRELARFSL